MKLFQKSLGAVFALAVVVPGAYAQDAAASIAAAQHRISALAGDPQDVSTLVFDNMTSFRNGVVGAVGTSTSSTPNTFMGDGYTLAAGTSTITGFDLFPVNLSGTAFTNLKLNIYVWGTVNTGAVSAATPAFSNLLASYSLTTAGAFASGFYYSFEGATPGVTPGVTLATPLAVTGPNVGLSFNYQGSTDGITYADVASLTSLITYGVPATTGANMFNGYYRNANSEVNGNFTSAVRTLGFTNQTVGVRVYGEVTPVPEPGTWLMMALGLGALLVRRQRG